MLIRSDQPKCMLQREEPSFQRLPFGLPSHSKVALSLLQCDDPFVDLEQAGGLRRTANVGLWHKADKSRRLLFVRFRSEAAIDDSTRFLSSAEQPSPCAT